jgi:glycine/D-amino acid oxidase-like deaminating enzyme/nitrite reductase/ring-hydroxylating ferredoxin subunit
MTTRGVVVRAMQIVEMAPRVAALRPQPSRAMSDKQTHSIWRDTFDVPTRAPLRDHITTDACVVGAGIAGLSVAYALALSGKRVVVLDKEQIGSGESGRTTAHLTNALDDRYFTLEKARGPDSSRIAAEAHSAAIDFIEEAVKREQLDCDFTRLDGYLFLGGGDPPSLLDEELAAAHRAGLTGVTRVDGVPGSPFQTGPALRFPRQGRFHILKYLAGIARAIESRGGQIFGDSRVEKIEGGSPAMVTLTSGQTVAADDVVVCTNSPISDMVVTHTKMAPYRTCVVAFAVPKGTILDALYWDTPDPYHYIRLQPLDDTRDALIVGGEDYKTAHADDAGERFGCLEEWTRERFASASERIAQWTGQVLETNDYLAYIGKNPDGAEHVWIATGDSGMGMTHGTIAGLLLPTLLQGKAHPWAREFDPKRITLHGRELAELAKENADVALQYGDYVTPGQVNDVESIPRGEGRVIRRGMHKIAAYRDESGVVHERSAACTHVRCIVDWNTAEKSWDCPCHGSRFDPLGKVLNGPALEDLHPAPNDPG